MNKIISAITAIPLMALGAVSDLQSYTNYVYSTPLSTNNIIGKVMGATISYRYPRSEDIAFINEWFSEIDNLRIFIFTTGWESVPPTIARGIDRRKLKSDGSLDRILDFYFDVNTYTNMSDRTNLNNDYIDSNVQVNENLVDLGPIYYSSQPERMFATNIFSGGDYYIVTNHFQRKHNSPLKISAITNIFSVITNCQQLYKLGCSVKDKSLGVGNISTNGTGYSTSTNHSDEGHLQLYTKNNTIIYGPPSEGSSSNSLQRSVKFSITSESTIYNKACCNILGYYDGGKWKITNNWYQVSANLENKSVTKNNYMTNGVWYVSIGGFTNLYFTGKRAVKDIKNSIGVFKIQYSGSDQKFTKYNHGKTTTETTTSNYTKYVSYKIPCTIEDREDINRVIAKWEIPSAKNFFQSIYPSGIWDYVKAPNPTSPSYNDVFDTLDDGEYYKNTVADGNKNIKEVTFSIELVGYYIILELDYHTTYQ